MHTAVQTHTIIQTLSELGRYRVFAKALHDAGLTKVLEGHAALTIFAPEDAAFELIPRDVKQELFTTTRLLTELVTYHIVAGHLTIADLMGLSSARTLQGEKIAVNGCDGLLVNDAKVIDGDIEAGNGIIHGITALLLPRQLTRWWK